MLTTDPPFIEFETMAAIFKIATCKHPLYELPSEVSDVCVDMLNMCFRQPESDRPSAEHLLHHKFAIEFT